MDDSEAVHIHVVRESARRMREERIAARMGEWENGRMVAERCN